VSPFTRDGRAIRGQVFHELMTTCASANGLTFPILAVHSLPTGAIAAMRYQEPSHEGEVVADFPEFVNKAFPVRTLYIDNNLRCVQSY
jgi:hypothetical protein